MHRDTRQGRQSACAGRPGAMAAQHQHVAVGATARHPAAGAPPPVQRDRRAQPSFPCADHFLMVSSATSKCIESLNAIPESHPSSLKWGIISAMNLGTFCFVLPGASKPTILKSTAVPQE